MSKFTEIELYHSTSSILVYDRLTVMHITNQHRFTVDYTTTNENSQNHKMRIEQHQVDQKIQLYFGSPDSFSALFYPVNTINKKKK